MFKLFDQLPTGEDDITEICDYVEVKSIISLDHTISLNDILKQFLQPADEDSPDGIDDYSDLIREKIEQVSAECQRRTQACGNKYPFELEYSGEVIKFTGLENHFSFLYVYLLFSTRLNMNENKNLDNVNGTDLLELISSEVSENYFGNLSKSYVVGTAQRGSFVDKMNYLCSLLGEGLQFSNTTEGPIGENDGGLDIVVWIDFSDNKTAKFIAFGQCKTGTNWEEHLTKLAPDAFCKSWLFSQPAFTPIRLFFISDILKPDRWYKKAVLAGLFFDRLRIVDKMPEKFSDELTPSIAAWTMEAIKKTKANMN